MRRIAALPDRCTRPARKDPVTTFDIFWQAFAENYPFFAAKGIDWRQVRERYRPRVSATTSDADLLKILADMIAPLNDAHTMLIAGDKVIYHVRPGTTLPTAGYGAGRGRMGRGHGRGRAKRCHERRPAPREAGAALAYRRSEASLP